MKRVLSLVLIAILIFGSVSFGGTDSSVTTYIDGMKLTNNESSFINDDGRTMVDKFVVFYGFGADFNYDEETETVLITSDDHVLTLTLGSYTYLLDGVSKTMDTMPVLKDGSIMLPIRAVAEALDFAVNWEDATRSVIITSPGFTGTTITSAITTTTTTTITSDDSYVIVTTGQASSYDNEGQLIDPAEGEDYYGQDADYSSPAFSYTDNGDGTVTDNNTGLMWQQIPVSELMAWEASVDYCENLELAGYDDWRIPTAKELFNLSDFSEGWPFLDTDYFEFPTATAMTGPADGGPQGGGTDTDTEMGAPQGGAPQGTEVAGADKVAGADLATTESGEMPPPPMSTDEDSDAVSKQEGQFWSSNFYYAGTTHGGLDTAFGVNHATGHIKGYPSDTPDEMGKYVRAVRGTVTATNDFVDNGDGTVTDEATGLMWMQDDNGEGIEWDDALEYAENFEYGGYDDWRLPDIKELQSIVDYSGSYPAIDQSVFNTTVLDENENYYFWSNTSAYFSTELPDYGYAWYVAFGKAVGDDGEDSHGAGAVRFSPKYTESSFAGEGGDNILNSVRLVRDAD